MSNFWGPLQSSLKRALTQFTEHYPAERNHQGKGNVLLFPRADELCQTCWTVDSMSRAPRRSSQVLLPKGRVNFLTIRDEWVTQLLRQGDAKVFKKYSQMKLQMKREALQKLNRKANEDRPGFDTERPN